MSLVNYKIQLDLRKMSFREVERFTQGHTAKVEFRFHFALTLNMSLPDCSNPASVICQFLTMDKSLILS